MMATMPHRSATLGTATDAKPRAALAEQVYAQIKAELEEAKRLGNIPADGETGMTMREKYPNRYPAK